MPNYSFSVGKVLIKQGATLIKTVLPLRDINIRYEVTTTRELGEDGTPLHEYKEEERTTITFSFASGEFDTSLMTDEDYDLIFATSGDKGISVTLANCKLTGYSLTTAQSEFAIVTITFSKRGAIDSSPGDTVVDQKVKFSKEGGGDIYIGDSAYIVTSYTGNVQPLIIPTALGVLVRSTQSLGGGQLDIRVRGYVKKDTRLELEQYLINLYQQLEVDKGTLTVEYGLTSYTLADCSFQNGSPDAHNKNHTSFELTFVKSAF